MKRDRTTSTRKRNQNTRLSTVYESEAVVAKNEEADVGEEEVVVVEEEEEETGCEAIFKCMIDKSW